MSLRFPFDSLNLSYLINGINSGGISLVGINGYICREKKFGKKTKEHRYIEIAPAS